MNDQMTPAKISLIEQVMRWLEERPRLLMALRGTASATAALLYVAVWAAAAAAAGAILALALAAGWAVVTASSASADAHVDGWVRLAALLAGVGGLAGFVLGVAKLDGGVTEDDRTQAAIARGVVAQAIVAHELGQRVRRLRLGIAHGGSLERSLGCWTEDGTPRAGLEFDELVLLFADPVTERWTGDLDPAWVRRVSEQADLLVAQAAVDGTASALPGRSELLSRAAGLSRDILAAVPDEVAESIEDELRRAGTMRGSRFERLLQRAVDESRDRADQQDDAAARPRPATFTGPRRFVAVAAGAQEAQTESEL